MHPNILLPNLCIVNHSSTASWHAGNKVEEQFQRYHSESGLYSELKETSLGCWLVLRNQFTNLAL